MKKQLPILAIESSGELCSTSVMLGDESFVEMNILKKHIHSEKLLDMIDTVLKNANVELNDLSHLAVSIGPGSFTGLRIGLSVAKGIGMGNNLPIVPVPSFNAFGLQINSQLILNMNFAIMRTASIDEIYYAAFISKENSALMIEEVKLINKDSVSEITKDVDLIFSDNVDNKAIRRITGLRASYVAKWSYLFGQDLLTFDYDYLEPFYLKKFIVKRNKWKNII